MSTTRTMSPYFSPKSIIAPSFRASSIGVSKMRTGRFANTRSLTRCSTSARSSADSAAGCVKSKRSLSGRTAEPACFTCSPSTSRRPRAADACPCGSPSSGSAPATARRALHAVARGEAGALEQQRLVVLEAVRLAQLGARAVLLLDPAGVGHLAAAGRIERRLAQLREEEAVLRAPRARRSASAPPSSRSRRTRVRNPAAVANSAARCALPPATPAREISRCSSISRVYSSSFTPRPRSRASSIVSSIGKPYVACERERVVAGDLPARRRLVEELHAALERLAEPLLLGGEHLRGSRAGARRAPDTRRPSARSPCPRARRGTAPACRCAGRAARRGG